MDRLRQEPHASQAFPPRPAAEGIGLDGGSAMIGGSARNDTLADARRSRRRGCLQTGSRRYRAGNSRAVRQRPAVLEVRRSVLAAKLGGPVPEARSATLQWRFRQGCALCRQGRIGLGRRKSADRRVCGVPPSVGRPSGGADAGGLPRLVGQVPGSRPACAVAPVPYRRHPAACFVYSLVCPRANAHFRNSKSIARSCVIRPNGCSLWVRSPPKKSPEIESSPVRPR